MEWIVGVTTCPRRVATLDGTIESLKAAGFPEFEISNDATKERGSYGNFRALLKERLSNRPAADVVAIFQDDIQLSRGLRSYLESDPRFLNFIRQGDLVSLYTAGPHHKNETGWHRLDPCDGQHFYGALAIVMPRACAEAFDANPPNPAALTQTDFRLGEFCKATGRNCWLHSPSFVRHTGDVSAIEEHWPESHRWFRNCGVFVEDCRALAAS